MFVSELGRSSLDAAAAAARPLHPDQRTQRCVLIRITDKGGRAHETRRIIASSEYGIVLY